MRSTLRSLGSATIETKPAVHVLLSGGIDSAACAAFYLEQREHVRGVFVDYGQAAVVEEALAAQTIATHYGIPLNKLTWVGSSEKGTGEIVGRNAFILVAALMEAPSLMGILAIGIHAGTRYVDCSSGFVQDMQKIFDAYTHGRVQIAVPFLHWSKPDIWAYCKSRRVPVELAYSCERGLQPPCGQCASCRDSEMLHACT